MCRKRGSEGERETIAGRFISIEREQLTRVCRGVDPFYGSGIYRARGI